MKTIAIRGATNIYINSREEILSNTRELLETMIIKNNLLIENIVSIIFTATEDLTKVYPAVAAREIGIDKAGLMCLNEMVVDASMENCLRVLLLYNASKDQGQGQVEHVYLRETRKLRPDLV